MSTAQLVREWEETAPPAPEYEQKHESSDSNNAELSVKADIDKRLNAEIKRAEKILELKDDWDGEGSHGYSEDTFKRAVAFLSKHVNGVWDAFNGCPPMPVIGPGPEGSIDLYWKQPKWELLVNIPADPNQMATYYGDHYGIQKIKSSIAQTHFDWGIAKWLMN